MIKRKYNVEARVYFPLITRGDANFLTGATITAGDAQISKDGGAFANIVGESDDDLFVEEGNGIYSIKVAAAELSCACAIITIIDQTSPKEWEDQSICVETYGHASAQHAFDLDTAIDAAEIADAVCDEVLAGHTTAGTLGKKISDIPTGLGAVAVDHNYGGTDALRYVDGTGSGIDNADIWIYLKSDYDAGRVSSNYVKAKTNTDVNGRWANPVNLDPAVYTIHVYKQGEYGPDTQEITVE